MKIFYKKKSVFNVIFILYLQILFSAENLPFQSLSNRSLDRF